MSSQKFVPKLFQGDMVRAIRREVNPKTQTRRGIKGNPNEVRWNPIVVNGHGGWTDEHGRKITAPCKEGDIIYVRETWSHYRAFGHETEDDAPVIYRADEDGCGQFPCKFDGPTMMVNQRNQWRPGIHMPKFAARIFLLVKSVKVERLQDISPADAIAEGIFSEQSEDGPMYQNYITGHVTPDPVFSYKSLWEKINGKGSWEIPQWVWVIEFEHLKDFKNPFQ